MHPTQSEASQSLQSASIELTAKTVYSHFARGQDSLRLLNFLLNLDQVDCWAVDYDETRSVNNIEILVFLTDLSTALNNNMAVLDQVVSLLPPLLSHLKSSRCLYVIQQLVQGNERFDRELLRYFDEHRDSKDVAAIRRRLDAVRRAHLLGEIFSGSRLERISKIMGSY